MDGVLLKTPAANDARPLTMTVTDALQAAQRTPPRPARAPSLLIAGATGALGNEVLRRLVGCQRYGSACVLAREPITPALRGVVAWEVPAGDVLQWSGSKEAPRGEIGIVLFDPPRLYLDRERALFTPTPEQLPALAGWMYGCGVRTLAVVLPHAPGRLPEALKRGLASLDEQAVAALHFDRLLLIRSARTSDAPASGSALQRLAQWMLGIFKYMIPSNEQPVRAVQVARLLDAALQLAPPGIHVVPPEVVWRATQGHNVHAVLAAWLAPAAPTQSANGTIAS